MQNIQVEGEGGSVITERTARELEGTAAAAIQNETKRQKIEHQRAVGLKVA